MRLFSTNCQTDWKGRPLHRLELVGEADTREALVALMDQDVREWQATDRASDVEMAEPGEPAVVYEDDGWGITNVRWEMALERDFLVPRVRCPADPSGFETLREFVLLHDEGNTSTLVYHIVP